MSRAPGKERTLHSTQSKVLIQRMCSSKQCLKACSGVTAMNHFWFVTDT